MKREELKKYYTDAKPLELDDATIERLRPLVDAEGEWAGDVPLTREAAVYDVECFFDLLKYCYAGYNYYADKVDFAQAKADVLAALPADGITSVNVKDALYHTLKPHINDTHFAFQCGGRESFKQSYGAYFTGLTVEECEGGYKVIRKEKGDVEIGHIFTAEEVEGHLFETFPDADGTKRYLVGVLTDEKTETLEIGGFELPLHFCRTDTLHEPKEWGVWSEWNWNGLKIVKHTNYLNEEVERTREAFGLDENANPYLDHGKKLRNDPVFMWSLLGNCGGNSEYPKNFILGLNDYAVWMSDCAILRNPILDKNMTEKVSKYSVYQSEEIDHSRAAYEGHLFVVQNKGVASSGEAAVKFAESVKNVHFVGGATSGCGQFGDLRRYRLPNSGVKFVMGYKVFNMDGFEEGKGLAPDYWLDTTEPFSDIEDYIRLMRWDIAGDEWHAQMKNRLTDDLARLLRDMNDYAKRADIGAERKAAMAQLGERIRAEVEETFELK